MNVYSVSQYRAVGCMQFEPGIQFGMAIYTATNGRMCSGCPKIGQECYRRLTGPELHQRRAAVFAAGETVRQEAARLGVTIAEVRRRRSAP